MVRVSTRHSPHWHRLCQLLESELEAWRHHRALMGSALEALINGRDTGVSGNWCQVLVLWRLDGAQGDIFPGQRKAWRGRKAGTRPLRLPEM
jgi:hypothetical protein